MSYGETVEKSRPDYTHVDPCRQERKDTITFDLHVEREFELYLTSLIAPTVMLVITSWAGFFLKIQALMPRIATAFISFLNIIPKYQRVKGMFPPVNYVIWANVFMDIARYSVSLSIIGSVCAHFVYEVYSGRIAKVLDQVVRIIIPANYAIMVVSYFS